jgi:hypothetical protein
MRNAAHKRLLGAPGDTGRRRAARAVNSQLRCIVDSNGRQHFNFAQRVWLRPAIPMAYTKVPSTAMTTLAANLLTLALEERGEHSESSLEAALAARYALALARQFSRECLLNAPDEGWVIPRAAIRAWLATRLPRLPRGRRLAGDF